MIKQIHKKIRTENTITKKWFKVNFQIQSKFSREDIFSLFILKWKRTKIMGSEIKTKIVKKLQENIIRKTTLQDKKSKVWFSWTRLGILRKYHTAVQKHSFHSYMYLKTD